MWNLITAKSGEENYLCYGNRRAKTIFRIDLYCTEPTSFKLLLTTEVCRTSRYIKEDYVKIASKRFENLLSRLEGSKFERSTKNQMVPWEDLANKLASAELKIVNSSVFINFSNPIKAHKFHKLLVANLHPLEVTSDQVLLRDHLLRLSDNIFNIVKQNPLAYFNLCCQNEQFVKDLEAATQKHAEATKKYHELKEFFKKGNFELTTIQDEEGAGKYSVTLSNSKDLQRFIELLAMIEDITELQKGIFSCVDFQTIMKKVRLLSYENKTNVFPNVNEKQSLSVFGLPTEIATHIFSFFNDTKELIRTRRVSKNFKNTIDNIFTENDDLIKLTSFIRLYSFQNEVFIDADIYELTQDEEALYYSINFKKNPELFKIYGQLWSPDGRTFYQQGNSGCKGTKEKLLLSVVTQKKDISCRMYITNDIAQALVPDYYLIEHKLNEPTSDTILKTFKRQHELVAHHFLKKVITGAIIIEEAFDIIDKKIVNKPDYKYKSPMDLIDYQDEGSNLKKAI